MKVNTLNKDITFNFNELKDNDKSKEKNKVINFKINTLWMCSTVNKNIFAKIVTFFDRLVIRISKGIWLNNDRIAKMAYLAQKSLSFDLFPDGEISSKYKYTRLHNEMISDIENLELVKELINDRYDVNAQNSYGQTPLHLAVIEKKYQTALLLIQHGANLDIKDNHDRTVYDYLDDYEFDTQSDEKTELLDKLKQHRKQVDQSRLHQSIRNGDLEAVKEELTNGFPMNSEGTRGTPLDLCVIYDQYEIAIHLFREGAILKKVKPREYTSEGMFAGAERVIGSGANKIITEMRKNFTAELLNHVYNLR